jgi:hypothetical protein
MRVIIVSAGCLAIGVALAVPTASAQGPIREGAGAVARGAGAVARGVGEAAAGVAEGTVDAGRAVIGGTARAAGEVAEGTVDAGRAVIGGTARAAAAGIDAITPDLPLQARAGATLRAGEELRDARWRFAQHNGEWWYYSPENNWMYHRDGQWNEFAEDSFVPNAGAGQFGGEYASGYRGVDQGGAVGADQYGGDQFAQGQAYTLQYDENGREFICDNGQRVYFDDQSGGQGQWGDPTPGIPAEAGYRGGMPEPATGTPTLDAQGAAAGATPPAQPTTGAGVGAGAGVTTPPASADVGAAATTPQAGAAAGAGATAPGASTQPAGTAPAAGAGVSGAIEGGLPAEPAQ